MTNCGLYAHRFHHTTNSLRRFDEALRYFKRTNVQEGSNETLEQTQKLLFALKPIAELLNGQLSETMNFDEHSVVEILWQRHARDWQRYKESIIQLTNELTSGNRILTNNDFEILNDVADAIDTECANLFRRMSGRE